VARRMPPFDDSVGEIPPMRRAKDHERRERRCGKTTECFRHAGALFMLLGIR